MKLFLQPGYHYGRRWLPNAQIRTEGVNGIFRGIVLVTCRIIHILSGLKSLLIIEWE